MKQIVYVNDGKKPHGVRSVDSYTAENVFGFNNPDQKTAAPAPYLNAGGGLLEIAAGGETFSGNTPKKVIISHGTFNSTADRPLVVTLNGKTSEVGVGQDLPAIMPGDFTLHVAFKDGKAGQANLMSRH